MVININTASKEELKAISGIGESTAEKIMRFRDKYGLVTKDSLAMLFTGELKEETLKSIDFTIPKEKIKQVKEDGSKSVCSVSVKSPSTPLTTKTSIKMLSVSTPGDTVSTPTSAATSVPLLHDPLSDPSGLAKAPSAMTPPDWAAFIAQIMKSCRESATTDLDMLASDLPNVPTRDDAKLDTRYAAPRPKKTHERTYSPKPRTSSPEVTDSKKKDKASVSRPHNKGKHSAYKDKYKSRKYDGETDSGNEDKQKSGSVSRSSNSKSSESNSYSHSPVKKDKKGKKVVDSKISKRSHHRRSRSQSRSRSTGNSKKGKRATRSRSTSPKQSKQRSKRSSSSSGSRSRSRSRPGPRRKPKRDKSKKQHFHLKQRSERSSSSSGSRSKSRSRSRSRRKSKSAKSKKRHSHLKQRSKNSSSSSRSRSRSKSRSRSRSPGKPERAKSTRRHFQYYYDSTSEDEDYVPRYRPSEKRGDPRKLPKNLRYDGKSSWLSYKQKFESYMTVLNWSEGECRDYLNWSLEGKASDFFTITTSMGDRYSFSQIMKKLEARFGAQELSETARAKFRQASQNPGESLEDWADRVLTLATPAFRDLPESHRRQEAISKFCQGCLDKDAAKQACFVNPKSIEAALNLVKHHQYITQAVDGKKYPGRKGHDEISVNAVGAVSEARVEQLIEKALEKMTKKLQKTEVTTEEQQKEQKPTSSSGIQCFFCKKRGHAKKDCFRYKKWLEKKTAEEKSNEDLNREGPAVQATQPGPHN